jgi:hypothetical protein
LDEKKNVLQEIVRIRLVSNDSFRDTPHQPGVTPEKNRQGIPVPRGNLQKQRFVGRLLRIAVRILI